MFPRRETEASNGEVPSYRPAREGVAEMGGPEAFTLWAVLMVRDLYQDLGWLWEAVGGAMVRIHAGSPTERGAWEGKSPAVS